MVDCTDFDRSSFYTWWDRESGAVQRIAKWGVSDKNNGKRKLPLQRGPRYPEVGQHCSSGGHRTGQCSSKGKTVEQGRKKLWVLTKLVFEWVDRSGSNTVYEVIIWILLVVSCFTFFKNRWETYYRHCYNFVCLYALMYLNCVGHFYVHLSKIRLCWLESPGAEGNILGSVLVAQVT